MEKYNSEKYHLMPSSSEKSWKVALRMKPQEHVPPIA